MKDSKFTLLYLGTTNVRLFPPFLRDFVHGIFSLLDVSFHGLYVKKITDTNGLDNSKQHTVN